MSRKPIIAGNWKMNKNVQEAMAFVEEVKDKLPSEDLVEAVVGASPVLLNGVKFMSNGSVLKVAAQNCYFEDAGAFTGETSPKVLADMGVDYVIIGHSERRDYFHETDEDINKKAHAIFRNGLTPIICCGESLETYEAGQAVEFVGAQVSAALAGLTAEQVASTVIAYEPIWAIGTGVTASTEQAQDMLAYIRGIIADKYGKEIAEGTSILYGGSCNAKNAPELFAQPDIDGGLIGGASLKVEDFKAIIDAF